MDVVENLAAELRSPDRAVRRRAIKRVSAKSGRAVVLQLRDERVLPLLIEALSDDDLEVQRGAARALRPWVQSRPELFDEVLPLYACHDFDGSYSHVGLYDIARDVVWLPRFQANKGHASLLSDGDTDRYFKFQFYRPHQAPKHLAKIPEDREKGHLVLHLIPHWSYSKQRVIPGFDERALKANLRQQTRHATAVTAFYRRAGLPYAVSAHHLVIGCGKKDTHELNVAEIPAVKVHADA